MILHNIKLLRRLALPLLARFGNIDFTIRHHYTGHQFHLNVFRHRGYWFYGRKRESETMISFARLIHETDTVIDIGGHIGYMSLYFAALVGSSGRVFVFEPGINNLPYTLTNLSGIPNITLINKAVSNRIGRAPFYIENVAGQNNSLVKDFWVFDTNLKNSFVDGKCSEVSVETITLDRFVNDNRIKPRFIKIDVEGSELDILQGGLQTLKQYTPILMLEVNMHHEKVYDLILANNYVICSPSLRLLSSYQDNGMPSIFCLHREAHAHILRAATTSSQAVGNVRQ